jgi:hypothetical protein
VNGLRKGLEGRSQESSQTINITCTWECFCLMKLTAIHLKEIEVKGSLEEDVPLSLPRT